MIRSVRVPSHHDRLCRTTTAMTSCGWFLMMMMMIPTRSIVVQAATPKMASLSSSSSLLLLLLDRFTPKCPADLDDIRKFDPSLVRLGTSSDEISLLLPSSRSDDEYWVAVHRSPSWPDVSSSNNNQHTTTKPISPYGRDEFLMAMRSATDRKVDDAAIRVMPSTKDEAGGENGSSSNYASAAVALGAPVAVARLYRPKTTNNNKNNNNDDDDDDDIDYADHYLLDSMRCVLRKEETDASCDGSSEHAEALCVAIDTLLEYYLESLMRRDQFEGAIRTKATLVAAPLLESRGFVPVQTLRSDMASHVSSLDQCLSCYAERAVAVTSQSTTPAARQRAINIVARLGRIDRASDLRERQRLDQEAEKDSKGGDADDYDPWRSMRRYI
jgi:hypothetical protein